MSEDYTPTTSEVRDAALSYTSVIYSEAEFDRWLSHHAREIRDRVVQSRSRGMRDEEIRRDTREAVAREIEAEADRIDQADSRLSAAVGAAFVAVGLRRAVRTARGQS